MDAAQHYPSSGIVYHPLTNPLAHSVSNPPGHQPFPQDIPWQSQQHSASASSSSPHSQMNNMMSHVQHPHAVQQSFVSRHVSDSFTNHSPSLSADPGSAAHQMSFDPQVESNIGPERVFPRRRTRMSERLMSHGDIPDYSVVSQPYGHPPQSQYAPPSGSRPHTPSQQPLYALPEHGQSVMAGAANVYGQQRMDNVPRLSTDWRFPPPQSRSASGSTASATSAGSASSNPRSASPALSTTSVRTSVSSHSSAPLQQVAGDVTLSDLPPPRVANKKRRLATTDRFQICEYADKHPGIKQEDIAIRFGVERSTVSKILKHKDRWLCVPSDALPVTKFRPSKFPRIEVRLEDWVKEAAQNGRAITDSLLREEARKIGNALGYTPEKFKASSGWLENFKHRAGIRRGVYYGNGLLHQKVHSIAFHYKEEAELRREKQHAADAAMQPPPSDSLADSQYRMDDQPPPPLDGPTSYAEHELGAESEDEEPSGGHGDQAIPPSTSLSQAWSQDAQTQPIARDDPSSAPSYYPEQERRVEQQSEPQHLEEPPMQIVQPEPIMINEGGEEVYIVPVVPEVVSQEEPSNANEAEHHLDQVLRFIWKNYEELGISHDDLNVLQTIKTRLFQAASNQRVDMSYLPRPQRKSS